MSKLKDKRYAAIRQRMISRGIEYGNHIFMSLWDLADNLNNCWHAEDFISKNGRQSGRYGSDKHGRFVVNSWNLPIFWKPIRHAVRGSDIELRESYNNKTEYLIMKAPK